jgi:hypothetical protein
MFRRSLGFVLVVVVISSIASCKSRDGVVEILKNDDLLTVVDVEIANTPSKRHKGLMFRKSLPQSRGMWFIFDENTDAPFWMENTQISLDIFFIDNQNRIVSVASATEPFSREQINPASLYKYVLEVNRGFADRYGLSKGDVIRLKK